jgi:hypothetical protein
MYGTLGIEYLERVPFLFEKQFKANLCLADATINSGENIWHFHESGLVT